MNVKNVKFCQVLQILSNMANFVKYGKFCQIWQTLANMANFVKYGKFCQMIISTFLEANLDFLGREFSLFNVANDFWSARAHSSWTKEIALAAVARNHNVVSSFEAFFLRITLNFKL